VPIANDITTFSRKSPYLYIDLYVVCYISSELRFVPKKNKSKDQSNQYISRKNMTIFDLFGLFFEFVWAYLNYLEDMKNKDTIYWGIPWRVWRYQREVIRIRKSKIPKGGNQNP